MVKTTEHPCPGIYSGMLEKDVRARTTPEQRALRLAQPPGCLHDVGLSAPDYSTDGMNRHERKESVRFFV
ncbi:MAG: hypothetical protein JW982_13920 [Spirochaetes bacterium]|nr:hypothetical protein [Spirochaetota bacterium]